MKLISFTASGHSSYGAVVGDRIVDLGRRLRDRYPTLRAAIAGGALAGAAAEVDSAATDIALSQVTLLPPITDPDKIICAGRNYRAHAAEAGGAPPENPSVFLRLVNTLVAHNQPMVCPKISGDFDYEGELALIIGKPGRHITKHDAMSHVFGYTCFNDGSIRDIQFKHSIAAGKNFHSTGGFGPWIVTADEIADPTQLHLMTRLNGREVQHTGIDDLIFDIPTLISYCSDWTPLAAGDEQGGDDPKAAGAIPRRDGRRRHQRCAGADASRCRHRDGRRHRHRDRVGGHHHPVEPTDGGAGGPRHQPPQLRQDGAEHHLGFPVQRDRHPRCGDRPGQSDMGDGGDGGQRNGDLYQLAVGAPAPVHRRDPERRPAGGHSCPAPRIAEYLAAPHLHQTNPKLVHPLREFDGRRYRHTR